jgi:hypothetical protein
MVKVKFPLAVILELLTGWYPTNPTASSWYP